MNAESVTFLLEDRTTLKAAAGISGFQDKLSREALGNSAKMIFCKCRRMWPSDKVTIQVIGQAACYYLIAFLLRRKLKANNLLKQLVRQSITLACKMRGISRGPRAMRSSATLDLSQTLEQLVAFGLNWSLDHPTVHDVQWDLLNDFDERNMFLIIKHSRCFVEACYGNEAFICKGTLAVACAATCIALTKLNLRLRWKLFEDKYRPNFGEEVFQDVEELVHAYNKPN